MSLKFACQKCHQTLVTTERKVGQSVRCPRCAESIVVPDQETAAALLEMKRAAREKASPPVASSQTSRPTNGASHATGGSQPTADAKPQRAASSLPLRATPSIPPSLPPASKIKPREAVRASRTGDKRSNPAQTNAATAPTPPSAALLPGQAASVNAQTARTAAQPAVPAAEIAAHTVDPRRVSISRWVLFAQAGLIAAVAAVAYMSGYVIGGGSPRPTADASSAPKISPVQVTGAARYGADPKAADSDAVIIVLPKNAAAAEKIAIIGLRPEDPAPAANNAQVRIIESLDGAYARADGAGNFRLSVRPGEYLVLAISRHSQRPGDQNPSAEQLALLGQFFTPAGDLLGQSKYDLSERTLSDAKPLEFDF